ncbi:MAG: hypothetical protein R3A44_02535 [Caldilineaceae bacterium]
MLRPSTPLYWAEHLRKTVRFADGVGRFGRQRQLRPAGSWPRSNIVTLARQHPNTSAEQVVLSTRSHAQQNGASVEQYLQTLGRCGWPQVDWRGALCVTSGGGGSICRHIHSNAPVPVRPGAVQAAASTRTKRHYH